jgi:hypothetical protein
VQEKSSMRLMQKMVGQDVIDHHARFFIRHAEAQVCREFPVKTSAGKATKKETDLITVLVCILP